MISAFIWLVASALLVYWSRSGATELAPTIVVETPIPVDTLWILHDEICASVPSSPLCKDRELLNRVESIAEDKGVPVRLIIGIMFAESTLATNYNKPECKWHNNPYGIKWRKYDDGKVVWYTKTKGRPDEHGCWLYRFSSIEEATYSLANTISIGYAGCNNSVICLSYKYVWNPEVSEKSWVDRVAKFYQ